jgi:glycosyltransferase involved in cell wall biosynthesis
MKVGLIAHGFGMQSLRYVFQGIAQTLEERHEIVDFPYENYHVSPRKQEESYEELLLSCDVIIGRIDENVLRARSRISRQPPLIAFLLGTVSRGGSDLSVVARHLKTTDVLVGNCIADIEIVRKFFSNAQTRNLPFAFDESIFYPSGEPERQALRAEMGFRKEDKILLYAGRVTIEKNLHTLLRIFSVLQDLVPDLHLVIAGELDNVAFSQMGVYPVSVAGTITRLISELQLNTDNVHVLGSKSPTQLRDLYAVADVMVNMTLHHDENFGFAQVEAMACGTPVVGTGWGGLKDSIKHGETGYQVSTVVTDAGVKVNWWEAVNRIVLLLEDEALLAQFREKCRAHALEKFSRGRYSATLESILGDCMKRSKSAGEPLAITDFADQYWHECQFRSVSPPPYQRGRKAFELYRELITPFTGATENLIPAVEPLSPSQLLVLAVPVRIDEGVLRVDDLITPLDLVMPEAERESCVAALEILRKEPVIRVERMESLAQGVTRNSLQSSLRWMLDTGILLRTKTIDASIDPGAVVGEKMGRPVFSIRSVDFSTDVIVIR